jgi:uncharacterized membrane protein
MLGKDTKTMTKNQIKFTTIRLTVTALFMAMNIAMSSFGVPVPGGHLYLCDIVICTAAILLNPLEAFVVGGIGSFLGDMIFYPLPMFVSLVTHGLQAMVISVFAHYVLKKHPKIAAGIGVSIGVLIMVAGYTFGKAFIYSTPEYAIMKLPYEFAQGILGAVFGMLLVFRCGIKKVFNLVVGANDKKIEKTEKDKTLHA